MARLQTVLAVAAAVMLAGTASAAVVPDRHKAIEGAITQAAFRGEPATVPTLNVTAYLGRWYEVYQDWSTANTFQKDSYCATADYGVDAAQSGRITVANKEHHGSITGPEVNVSGYAYQPDPATYPGRLIVYLHGDHSSPFPAPYWVLKLGPIVDGKYDYAVVSDNFRLTLFVLTRDVMKFYSAYEADVLTFLADNGFTQFWNKPQRLPQLNCTYYPQ